MPPPASSSALPATPDAGTEEPNAEPTVLTSEQRERDAVLAKKVAPFVDAYTNDRPALLDGDRVAFVSTRDGMPALYVADARAPKSSAKKLAVPNERIATHTPAANGKYLLFASDVKSDGNFKIFRTDLEGTL